MKISSSRISIASLVRMFTWMSLSCDGKVEWIQQKKINLSNQICQKNALVVAVLRIGYKMWIW